MNHSIPKSQTSILYNKADIQGNSHLLQMRVKNIIAQECPIVNLFVRDKDIVELLRDNLDAKRTCLGRDIKRPNLGRYLQHQLITDGSTVDGRQLNTVAAF